MTQMTVDSCLFVTKRERLHCLLVWNFMCYILCSQTKNSFPTIAGLVPPSHMTPEPQNGIKLTVKAHA